MQWANELVNNWQCAQMRSGILQHCYTVPTFVSVTGPLVDHLWESIASIRITVEVIDYCFRPVRAWICSQEWGLETLLKMITIAFANLH